MLALVGAACGASGGNGSAEDDNSRSTTSSTAATTAGADSPDFGTISSPCHAGAYSVKPGEQQGAEKTIQIGVPNDRG